MFLSDDVVKASLLVMPVCSEAQVDTFMAFHLILLRWRTEEDEEEEIEAAPSQSNSRVAMIVKECTTASGSHSSDGSEQEPLHLPPAGQSPSTQVGDWTPFR